VGRKTVTRRAAGAVAIAALVAGCGQGASLSPGTGSTSPSHRPVSNRLGSDPSPTSATTTTTSSERVPGTDRRVWVEGDSVLLGTLDTLPEALRGWSVHMDTVGSRRLTEAIPVLRANRSNLGNVVAIQMGNNYITGEDGDFASQLVTAMHIMRNVERVVWVTVAKASPSQVEIDRDIITAARTYPSIRVANWAPIIAEHPDYGYDGLHLTPSGRVAMARLIAREIGPPAGESILAFRRHLRTVTFSY
jgi:hypothetical protein